MATLTVLKFPTAQGAEQMLSTLQTLQGQQVIQIEDGAIVTWPVGASQPTTQQLSSLTGVGPLRGAFRGLLFGFAVGVAMGAFARPLAHYGMDEDFIKRVRDQITEGTSTLFLLTSGAVLDNVIASLKDRQFEIISTTLSQQQEGQLRQAFLTAPTSSPKSSEEQAVASGVQGPSSKERNTDMTTSSPQPQPDRTVLPIPDPAFTGVTNRTLTGSQPAFPQPVQAPEGAPNVLLILLDDAGFGNPSTFGGPIQTPTLDGLAQEGLRYNCFHVTALCSPSRAALLSGRNPHAVGFGSLAEIPGGWPGYNATWPQSAASLAAILRGNGYTTASLWQVAHDRQ